MSDQSTSDNQERSDDLLEGLGETSEENRIQYLVNRAGTMTE